jgi:hypothetical protein
MRSVTALHKLRNVSSAKLACLCLRIRIPPRRDVFSERRHLIGNFIKLCKVVLFLPTILLLVLSARLFSGLCATQRCADTPSAAQANPVSTAAPARPLCFKVSVGMVSSFSFLFLRLIFDLTHSLSRRGRPSILPATLYTLTH